VCKELGLSSFLSNTSAHKQLLLSSNPPRATARSTLRLVKNRPARIFSQQYLGVKGRSLLAVEGVELHEHKDTQM
jgi:hypothetical protein